MADNAGSSSTSSNVSSRYSSDTEMMVKPKRPRISKDSKVSARQKNKMKFQKTKRRHCKDHRYNSSYNDHSHKKPTNGIGGILTLQENAGIPLPLAHLELPPKIVMLVQTQTLLHLLKTVQDGVVLERYPKSPSPVQSAKEKRPSFLLQNQRPLLGIANLEQCSRIILVTY